MPIVFAIGTIVGHLGDFSRRSQCALLAPRCPQPPEWLAKLPYGERIASEWRAQMAIGPAQWLAGLQPYAGKITAWIAARAGSLGMLSLHVLLTIVLASVLYARGEVAAGIVKRFAHRIGGERGDNAVALAAQAIRAVAMGIVVTAPGPVCSWGNRGWRSPECLMRRC